LSERLRKQNTANAGFTDKALDWIVVYKEIFPEKGFWETPVSITNRKYI
jgi:hypothetical protein